MRSPLSRAVAKIGRRRDGDWMAGLRLRHPRRLLVGEQLHRGYCESA